MKQINLITLSIKRKKIESIENFLNRNAVFFVFLALAVVSLLNFLYYLSNGLGTSYNDARSHLDIGRRVVEGLKPGLAQLGSVWLPLPHVLMIPTVWNDFMWHSGLAGALQSMISFTATALLVYMFLKQIGVGMLGRLIGITVFAANINILYLQSTAMTELLLIATMMAGVYYLMLWFKDEKLFDLIKSSFWIMLSTLIRYDGWFLLIFAGFLIVIKTIKSKGYKTTEGLFLLFVTLGGFGIAMWFLWNQLIFKDALYFAFGPYSARAQQIQLEEAGVLATKGNLLFSFKIYIYALIYNSYAFNVVLGIIGAVVFWFDKNIKNTIKVASLALFAPFIFNILALYLGHSVLFIQGLSGNTWFNARYGIMMMPSIAIFIGYLIHKAQGLRFVLIGLLLFVTFFAFTGNDAVTIDDARVGSSQKNVSEIADDIRTFAQNQKGFILISAASHDAIIFSSGLPMKRFIHEGTGKYWESATSSPDRWARWIIMRTYDQNDQTFKTVSKSPGFLKYRLVKTYPFADIYEIQPEYLQYLNTD